MEEEDEFYPGYGSSIPPDDEDFIPNVPLPSQEEAIALDRQLTPMVPAPNFNSGEVAGPFQGSGNAMSEFLTGKPGLFVQGGSSLPAGQISVNGVLERSQAAPQPIPWWITAADDFKEQRRQEDFLRGLVAQSGVERKGEKGIERMQQLMGRMQLQNDLKGGMNYRDAITKNAANLFAGSPASMARLASERGGLVPGKPFVPTEATVGGRKLVQLSPNRYSFGPTEKSGLGAGQELGFIGQQMRLLSDQLKDVTLEAADADRIKAELADLKQQSDQLRGRGKKAAQTQTSPRVALANKLSQENPSWTKEQVKAEVLKQLK